MPILLNDIKSVFDGPVPPVDFHSSFVKKVNAEDHIVGEVPDDLKRLFVLAVHYWGEVSTIFLQASRSGSPEDRKRQTEEAGTLALKTQLLMDIFLVSLKDAFNLWGKPSVYVREGWQVVWNNSENPGFNFDDLIQEVFAP